MSTDAKTGRRTQSSASYCIRVLRISRDGRAAWRGGRRRRPSRVSVVGTRRELLGSLALPAPRVHRAARAVARDAPARRRDRAWPATATTSPASTPDVMTIRSSMTWPIVTMRSWSDAAFTTKTRRVLPTSRTTSRLIDQQRRACSRLPTRARSRTGRASAHHSAFGTMRFDGQRALIRAQRRRHVPHRALRTAGPDRRRPRS